MTNVDQFESVFKAATKTAYRYEPVDFPKVVVVTDKDRSEAESITDRVRRFLAVIGEQTHWLTARSDESETVEGLLGLVAREQPDMLVTYRNLHSGAWQWPHSLGRHVDVLTQISGCPVMVIPHPNDVAVFGAAMEHTGVVMGATDHLAGEGTLVNYAVSLTEPSGKLVMAHIEDDAIFERYMEVISKIPSIDTDNARQSILAQLLKEPHDYVRTCREALVEQGVDISVEEIISTGHRLSVYRRLIDSHGVELLVMHTKDEDQLAMHGLAFPLAVELRHIPLLMI